MMNDVTTATTTDVSQTVVEFDLDTTIAALNALPSKRNGQNLRETIVSMRPALRSAKERGYTVPELAAWLKERGLEIGPTTLRQYLAKKVRAPKKPPETDGIAPATGGCAVPAQPLPAVVPPVAEAKPPENTSPATREIPAPAPRPSGIVSRPLSGPLATKR